MAWWDFGLCASRGSCHRNGEISRPGPGRIIRRSIKSAMIQLRRGCGDSEAAVLTTAEFRTFHQAKPQAGTSRPPPLKPRLSERGRWGQWVLWVTRTLGPETASGVHALQLEGTVRARCGTGRRSRRRRRPRLGGAASCGAGDGEGVEGGAAEGAGRGRRGPGLGADGLDDAAAAEAVVAAGEQLEAGRALHAHHAQVIVAGLVRRGEQGGLRRRRRG